MTRGTITPAGGHKPRHAASLICWRFSAKFTASRIRLSCHGDFGSHWSANSTQKIDACFEDTTCIRGSRLRPSASGPSSTYPMSASPLLSITARVVDSGTLFMTSVFTLGTRRQYPGYASSTTSTPGLWLTNLYGPAPIGCFLKASSPTSVRYFLGTTIPAAVADLRGGIRADERVVERVEDAEGGDLWGRGGGVEPARRDRHVPGHGGLTRRRLRGGARRRAEDDDGDEQRQDDWSHDSLPCGATPVACLRPAGPRPRRRCRPPTGARSSPRPPSARPAIAHRSGSSARRRSPCRRRSCA